MTIKRISIKNKKELNKENGMIEIFSGIIMSEELFEKVESFEDWKAEGEYFGNLFVVQSLIECTYSISREFSRLEASQEEILGKKFFINGSKLSISPKIRQVEPQFKPVRNAKELLDILTSNCGMWDSRFDSEYSEIAEIIRQVEKEFFAIEVAAKVADANAPVGMSDNKKEYFKK